MKKIFVTQKQLTLLENYLKNNNLGENDAPNNQTDQFLPITTPMGSSDFKLFKSVVNKGIDSHLEGFTKSKFIKQDNGRFLFNFHKSELPILIRRLNEFGTDEAMQWADDIENYKPESEESDPLYQEALKSFNEAKSDLINEGYTKKQLDEIDFGHIWNKTKDAFKSNSSKESDQLHDVSNDLYSENETLKKENESLKQENQQLKDKLLKFTSGLDAGRKKRNDNLKTKKIQAEVQNILQTIQKEYVSWKTRLDYDQRKEILDYIETSQSLLKAGLANNDSDQLDLSAINAKEALRELNKFKDGYHRKLSSSNSDSQKMYEGEIDEIFHGGGHSGGQTGAMQKMANKVFSKVGSILGNAVDILSKNVDDKVNNGEIDKTEGKRVFDILHPDVIKGIVKKDNIEQSVNNVIKQYIKKDQNISV